MPVPVTSRAEVNGDQPLKGHDPQAMPRWQAQPGKILLAGVGYRNLRDMSLGPVLLDQLARDVWPAGVEVEDLSYSPIGVVQDLDERGPYERMIFVGGVKRGRSAGGVYCYRWPHRLPDAAQVQARVAEAVMGIVSLDNLLIITSYFGKLSPDVIVIEVEAVDEGWGGGFSEEVEVAIPRVIDEIRRYVSGCKHPQPREYAGGGGERSL